MQWIAEMFWTRWRTYYLQELQRRNKWKKVNRNVKKGVVVILRRKNEPRSKWPLAVVEEVKTSADGLVRSAHVRSQGKVLRRAITDMVLLIEK